jgi:CRP/FNR family transcriptional regulator, cyclic AMP receptor protein
LQVFEQYLRLIHLEAGETLFVQGAQESVWYLVRSGCIEIQRNSRPETPHTLAELDPGEAFGEMSMLEQIPRMAAAVAIVKTELFCLDGEKFHELIEAGNPTAVRLLKAMAITQSRRLREITLTLQDITEADLFGEWKAIPSFDMNQFLFTSILSS